MLKYLLVIGDGMADEPLDSLGGRTPLQYAHTPSMDACASAGVLGSTLTVPDGLPAGSDVAFLSIFGCDPKVCYTGRAPLEAAATEIELSPGDVAYRCNMVTYEDSTDIFEDKKIISHSAGSIDGIDSAALIRWLFNEPEFKKAADSAGMTVYPAESFRHIAVQKSPDISGMQLIPPHDHLGETLQGILPRGGECADLLKSLMRLAHSKLCDHPINIKRRDEGKLPANGIWFWAEGTTVKLPDFERKYGKKGSMISAVPLCKGIGALIGLDVVNVIGATGELDTNYEGKVEALLGALENGDFAALHIEAPDECTHDGDLSGKLQAIERIDSRVIKPILGRLRGTSTDFRMLVMSDHRTLMRTRGHDGAAVPYLIYDSRFDFKNNLTYCEENCGRGESAVLGTDLMDILFETPL